MQRLAFGLEFEDELLVDVWVELLVPALES